MSQPTTSIGFSPSTPAAPTGNQNTIPQADGGTPLEKFSQYPQKATASLLGVVVPDGTTITVDGAGKISAVVGGVSVKTSNYTALAVDSGTLLSFNSASAITLTLPAAPPFAVWKIAVQNVGVGVLTIAHNSLDIDGDAADVTLAQGSGLVIFTDGTNYFTERGVATDVSTLASKIAVQQESYIYAADTGAANAYAVSLTPAPTVVAGSAVVFKAANANTGASTLAVNGGTATTIVKNGATALAGAEIASGQIVSVVFDGTNWQLVGSGSGGGGGGFTNPMTTEGDIIYGGASGVPTRLAAGSTGQVLQTNGSTAAPSWVAAGGGGGGGFSPFLPSPTAPVLADFTQTNWGTTTAVQKTNRIVIGPLVASGQERQLISNTALPATPYTIDLGLTANISGNLLTYIGILLKNGSNTIVMRFRNNLTFTGAGPQTLLNINELGSDTYDGPALAPGPLVWLRITDDGTNRKYWYSQNGLDYDQVYSETSGTGITAVNVGIACLYNSAANSPADIPQFSIYHYLVSGSILPSVT